MNPSELAGACIMTGFRGATLDDPQCRSDIKLLKDLHIKGVILFDKHLPTGGMRNIITEDQLRKLTDDLRNELGEDLIIGIDQEGGEINRLTLFQDNAVSEQLSARMQGAMSPKQLTAIIDPIAQALSDAGINLTFAPCVDLETNPDNPIIAGKGRSLGTDPVRVASAASTIISAYQHHGVRCCIKHFPGHGSSSTDTHDGLADITDSTTNDEQQVYILMTDSIKAGYTPRCAAMTGHLINKTIDPDLPASLSHAHTTNRLRESIGFDGTIITDSIDMGAVRLHHQPGPASVLAIQAGADIVLDGFNAPGDESSEHPAQAMHASLLDALRAGSISQSHIEQSIARKGLLFAQAIR